MLSTQELVDGFSPLHLSVIHSKIPTLKMMLNSCDADQRVQLLQCTDWSMWTPVTWSVQPKIVYPDQREILETIQNSVTPPQWVCLLEQSISHLNAASGNYGYDIRRQVRRLLENELTKANI